MIFAAISSAYCEADDYCSSLQFFEMPEIEQEALLRGVEMYKDLYCRLANFLNESGEVGALDFYQRDVTVQPKKDI